MRCTSSGLGLDELLQNVVEEEDRDKRVLMTQMIALLIQKEKEKEVIQMEKEKEEKEKEVIQMEKEVIRMEKEVIRKEMENEVLKKNQLNNELLSLKGELTARYLLERCVHKIKTEIGEELSRQSTKQVLGSVNKLQESACAQKLVAAVRDCNGQDGFAGRCYQDMYAELSGKIHYPPWKGPEILVHGRLNRLQLCVLQKVAETEDRDIVIFQTHEDGEDNDTDTGEPE